MDTQTSSTSGGASITATVPVSPADRLSHLLSETDRVNKRARGIFEEPATQKRVFGEFFTTAAPFVLVDVLSFALSLTIVVTAVNYYHGAIENWVQHSVMSAIALVIMLFAYRLYPGVGMNPIYEFRQCLMAVGATFVMVACAVLTGGTSSAVLLMFPILVILLPFMRSLTRKMMTRYDWWGAPSATFKTRFRASPKKSVAFTLAT